LALAPKEILPGAASSLAIFAIFIVVNMYFNRFQQKFTKEMKNYSDAIKMNDESIRNNIQTIRKNREKIEEAIDTATALVEEAKRISGKPDS
jgi:preprotein translocase subunit YajC